MGNAGKRTAGIRWIHSGHDASLDYRGRRPALCAPGDLYCLYYATDSDDFYRWEEVSSSGEI